MNSKTNQRQSKSASKLLLQFFALMAIVSMACDLGGLISLGGPIGQPEASKEKLFEGIVYERIVRQEPRAMVIHVVTIDLKAEGIKVLVTPGDPDADLPLQARTTSQFVSDFNVQLAINGDAFTPWQDLGPLGYSPKSGERVDPLGFAASNGTIYSQDNDEEPTLYIYQSNKASMNSLVGKIYNAISGNAVLLWNGAVVEDLDDGDAEPRTAVGMDRAGRRLILVIVDGRQSGYSEGATLAELAQIMLENKAFRGMNLDGGGSSTLAVERAGGVVQVLNSPVHQGSAGNERPVGNHLGFKAK